MNRIAPIGTRGFNGGTMQARGLLHWFPTSTIRNNGSNPRLQDMMGSKNISHSGATILTYDSVQIGTMLDFSAASYSLSSGRTLAGKTYCSVAAWLQSDVKDTGSGLGRGIWVERRSGGNEIFKLQMADGGTTGQLELVYRDTAGTLNRVRTTTVFEIDALHHVVFVKDGTAITWYIDGVSDNTGTLTASDTMTTISGTSLGTDSWGGNPWDGKMADVRAYDVALSPGEVKRIYEGYSRWGLYRSPQMARIYANAGAAGSTARSFSVVIA